MWSGAVNAIPTGWRLCNGQNGTPDLRNRFIVGAGSTYSVGNTGGSASVTLTSNQIPSHTHTCSSETISNSFSKGNTSINAQATHPVFAQGTFSSSATISMGSHTHTIGNTGGGSSHENRPPYYALAYIMKI